MDLGDLETTIKVIVVGNGHVGKSSMTTRYCKNIYTDSYKKTIGVDFMEKTIELDEFGESVSLFIWDTAGQEEFDSLTSRYYRGAGAAVLVFSTDDRDSFEALESWKRKVEDECGPIAMALVQNKIDLIDEARMTSDEVEAMARKLGLRLYRSCVKDNINVAEVFEFLTTEYLCRGDVDAGGAIAAIGDYAPDPTPSTPSSRPAKPAPEPSPSTDRSTSSPESSPGGRSPPAASAPTPKAARHSSTPKPATPVATAGATAAAQARQARAPKPATGGTIKLGPMAPSKVRTGNKKNRIPCSIL